MSLIDDYKNGKRYGTDWQAPSFQHMNDLVGTVSGADDKADDALSKSTTAESNSSTALTKATTAETNSTNAVNTANTANSNSQTAVTTANGANTKSEQAVSTANEANTKATNAETTANNLTQAPDVSEANKFGVVNVEIIGTGTNKKFKLSNLKGNGIATIAKTGSNGLQDIYTITFDNSETFSFNVTNGKSITNIEKTNTVGLVDTYTITYNDNSTDTFNITNGDSIELRVEDGYFQWKYTTSSTWNNLISLGELSNVDQELSETSTNAIANSTVTQALDNKSTIRVNNSIQSTLDFDSDPQTQITGLDTNKVDWEQLDFNGRLIRFSKQDAGFFIRFYDSAEADFNKVISLIGMRYNSTNGGNIMLNSFDGLGNLINSLEINNNGVSINDTAISNTVPTTNGFYIDIYNGIRILVESVDIPKNGTVNFDVAFLSGTTPYIVGTECESDSSYKNYAIVALNNTSLRIYNDRSLRWNFIAMGKWK